MLVNFILLISILFGSVICLSMNQYPPVKEGWAHITSQDHKENPDYIQMTTELAEAWEHDPENPGLTNVMKSSVTDHNNLKTNPEFFPDDIIGKAKVKGFESLSPKSKRKINTVLNRTDTSDKDKQEALEDLIRVEPEPTSSSSNQDFNQVINGIILSLAPDVRELFGR